MSVYGLRTFDAAGNIIIDITARLNRFRYSTTAIAGNAGSVVLADIDGLVTLQIAIPLDVSAFGRAPHQVTRSGTTISWAVPPSPWVSVDTLILVFLYV
jgi:hypothetical protein